MKYINLPRLLLIIGSGFIVFFFLISSPVFAQEEELPPEPVDPCKGVSCGNEQYCSGGSCQWKPCSETSFKDGAGFEWCAFQANGLTYDNIDGRRSGLRVCDQYRDDGGTCHNLPGCETHECQPLCNADRHQDDVGKPNYSLFCLNDPNDPLDKERRWSQCDKDFKQDLTSIQKSEQVENCAQHVPIDPDNNKFQSDWVCSDRSDDPNPATRTDGVACRRNYQAKIQFDPDPPRVGQNDQVRLWFTPSCKPQAPVDIIFKQDTGFEDVADFQTNCNLIINPDQDPPVPPLISQTLICNNDVINSKKRIPDPFDNNSPLQCRYEGICQATRTITDLIDQNIEKFTAKLTIKVTPTADYVGNGCSDTKDYIPKPYECNAKRVDAKETIMDEEWGARTDAQAILSAKFDPSVYEGVWNKDTGDNRYKIKRWSQALLPDQVNNSETFQGGKLYQDPKKCDRKEIAETGVQGGFLADLTNKVLCNDTLKGLLKLFGDVKSYCRLPVNQGGDCSSIMQSQKGALLAASNKPSMAPLPAPKDCGLFDVSVRDNVTTKIEQTQGDRFLDMYSASMGTKAGFAGSSLPVEALKDSITLDKRRNISTQEKYYSTKNAQENYNDAMKSQGQDGDWRIPESECMEELFAVGNYPQGIFPLTTPPPNGGLDPENNRRKSACIKAKI